jgi:hypothetical protein
VFAARLAPATEVDVNPTVVTTFRTPRPGRTSLEHRTERRPVTRADDVRVLADRVAGDGHHDRRWRATAATRLASTLLEEPAFLTPAVVELLDAALPQLLQEAGDHDTEDDVTALAALCAALGDRLSAARVCPPLQALVRTAPPRVAVAAHVACLMVEGLIPSAQQVSDLAALTDADPLVLAGARGRAPGVRAVALTLALADTG